MLIHGSLDMVAFSLQDWKKNKKLKKTVLAAPLHYSMYFTCPRIVANPLPPVNGWAFEDLIPLAQVMPFIMCYFNY